MNDQNPHYDGLSHEFKDDFNNPTNVQAPETKPKKKNSKTTFMVFVAIMVIVSLLTAIIVQASVPFDEEKRVSESQSEEEKRVSESESKEEKTRETTKDRTTRETTTAPAGGGLTSPTQADSDKTFGIYNGKATFEQDSTGKPVVIITFNFFNRSDKEMRFTDVLFIEAVQGEKRLTAFAYTSEDKKIIPAQTSRKCAITFYLMNETEEVGVVFASDLLMKNKVFDQKYTPKALP